MSADAPDWSFGAVGWEFGCSRGRSGHWRPWDSPVSACLISPRRHSRPLPGGTGLPPPQEGAAALEQVPGRLRRAGRRAPGPLASDSCPLCGPFFLTLWALRDLALALPGYFSVREAGHCPGSGWKHHPLDPNLPQGLPKASWEPL